jgi:hypothetical protein
LNSKELAFISAFESGAMPDTDFDHLAHMRLAWIYIQNFSLDLAIQKLNTGIKNFDQLKGDGTKYHKTVTICAALTIDKLIRDQQATDFNEFIRLNSFLMNDFKATIQQYYDFDVFSDPEAKKNFISPKSKILNRLSRFIE